MKTLLFVLSAWSFLMIQISFSPLQLILMLLVAVFSTSLGVWSASGKWFFITLVLLYAGGMMVVFSYFTTTASYHKISLSGWGLLFVVSLAVGVSFSGKTLGQPGFLWDQLYSESGAFVLWGSAGYLLLALLCSSKLGSGGSLKTCHAE